MSQLLVRNLDDTTKRQLRIRAAQNERSLEAEARAILTEAVSNPADDPVGELLERLKSRRSRVEPVVPDDAADHSGADFG